MRRPSGLKRHAGDPINMARESEEFGAPLGVPHFHSLVLTSRDNAATVRAESQTGDRSLMTAESEKFQCPLGRPRLSQSCQNFPRQCGDRPG